MHAHGRASNEYALIYAGKNDRGEVQDFRSCSSRNNLLSPIPSLLQCDRPPRTAWRGTLKYFEREHSTLTEGFITDEEAAYIEAMKKLVRSVKIQKATAGVIFVSPPGQVYLPRPQQQFLYLVTEAAFHATFRFA